MARVILVSRTTEGRGGVVAERKDAASFATAAAARVD